MWYNLEDTVIHKESIVALRKGGTDSSGFEVLLKGGHTIPINKQQYEDLLRRLKPLREIDSEESD